MISWGKNVTAVVTYFKIVTQ